MIGCCVLALEREEMTDPLNQLSPRAAGPSLALFGSLSRTVALRPLRRALAAGDADRQRIERDLHDGVQQRLTGLRLRLALAAKGFPERGDAEASAALVVPSKRFCRPCIWRWLSKVYPTATMQGRSQSSNRRRFPYRVRTPGRHVPVLAEVRLADDPTIERSSSRHGAGNLC
jgi:Histidine kinase